MTTAEYVEDESAWFDNTPPPRTLSETSFPPIQSQDNDSTLMVMGNYMDFLLTVFGEMEREERKSTNRWG